jgi:transposase
MHLPDLIATLPPELRDYIRELEERVAASSVYQGQVAQLEQRVAFLEDQFRLAQLKRFSPSSEKANRQGCLFNEAEQDAAAYPEEDEFDDMPDRQPTAPARKRGRKSLPAHLPRQRVEHDLPESEKVCACCQGALHRMGEETSEQLDIIPATVQALQHVRFKYACRQCDRHGESSKIVASPMPAQPIPGSNASPGTLATVLTAKYADGMPLYRQHAALLRGEVDIARGTLASWCIKAGMLLKPLYEAMRPILMAEPLIHGDETTVQVLKEDGRKAQSKSYM